MVKWGCLMKGYENFVYSLSFSSCVMTLMMMTTAVMGLGQSPSEGSVVARSGVVSFATFNSVTLLILSFSFFFLSICVFSRCDPPMSKSQVPNTMSLQLSVLHPISLDVILAISLLVIYMTFSVSSLAVKEEEGGGIRDL